MAIYKIKEIIKDEDTKTCCICGKKFEGYGNNPQPLKQEGVCCDNCNYEKVIPARINQLKKNKEVVKDSDDILDTLMKSEEKAIQEYLDAIKQTDDQDRIAIFEHILEEEKEHLEELKKLK